MENQQINHSDVRYLIVQAGGLGTRLGKHTINKPKCLVPVRGITLIENTLKQFAHCKVIIIGDYHATLLEKYLQLFCSQYNYQLITTDQKGTAAGLDQAVSMIPEHEPFAITWSDLFFTEPPQYTFQTPLAIGLTDQFECRWSWQAQGLENIKSSSNGVMGFYVFKDKSRFDQLSTEQSLVRGFLKNQYAVEEISTFNVSNCFEVGTESEFNKLIETQRFFNQITIGDHSVTKVCKQPEFQQLIQDEIAWYEAVGNRIAGVPQILSTEPLTLQKITGSHAHHLTVDHQLTIDRYCEKLHELHALEQEPANIDDCFDVYALKPQQRTQTAINLIPFATNSHIMINGHWCINPLYKTNKFYQNLTVPKHFCIIHGDPTFSNTLIDADHTVWFIDPRGKFGTRKIFGDPRYDWAKLYYSAVGNYDSINLKRFSVKLFGNWVDLDIQSNNYESFADQIISESGMSRSVMNYLQSSIWMSLTEYVKEDVDAMMYAFYMGVYLWNQQ